jgi:hypothetical protein
MKVLIPLTLRSLWALAAGGSGREKKDVSHTEAQRPQRRTMFALICEKTLTCFTQRALPAPWNDFDVVFHWGGL